MYLKEEQKIIEYVNNIIKHDPKIVAITINELIEKGIADGVYQNFAIISEIIRLLGYINIVSQLTIKRVSARKGKKE